MAKLNNVLSKIFGSGAGLNQISKFGSLFAGTPEFTTDPSDAQSLSNYLTGWAAAAIGGNSPAIEDMNAVLFAISYQLAYYQQAGIPEYNSGKEYFIGSLVNDGAGAIYVSKTDNNTGNLLSNSTYWTKVAGAVMTAIGDIIYGSVDGAMTKLTGNTTTQKQFLTQTGTGSASAAPVWQDFKPPNFQKILSGSGTYTPSAGVLYTIVEMVGGGGGGAGAGASPGGNTAGGNTAFGSAQCNGGGAGSVVTGGSGGSSTLGSFTDGIALTGANGSGGYSVSANVNCPGGSGGSSPFGGAGAGISNFQGGAAKSNTGSGGAGGGLTNTYDGGAGGGAGGYAKFKISNPSGTYSYSVGAAGNGSTGGANNGGSGAAGIIIITEYFQ